MAELYQIENLIDSFEKKINSKLERLENHLEIILKKIKDDNTKEFNSLLIKYREKIGLNLDIIYTLNNFSIDIDKIDTEKQTIFLCGSISLQDFLTKNIIPERFVCYTESD